MRSNLFGWYLRNCAESLAAGDLMDIIARGMEILRDEGVGSFFEFRYNDDFLSPSPKRAKRKATNLDELRNRLRVFEQPALSAENTDRNVMFAVEEFQLGPIDREILVLLLRYEKIPHLEGFGESIARRLRSISQAIACLIGQDHQQVHARLLSGSPLIDIGIISIGDHTDSYSGLPSFMRIAQPLRSVMDRPFESRDAWVTGLLGSPLVPSLRWDDFDHLGSSRELVLGVSSGAAATRTSGINLLLHGPVGTGKTEFVKVVGAKAGCTMWSVGEGDEHGPEPSSQERLSSLRLAQRLLSRRPGAIIVFDEAEDLLAGPSPFTDGDKRVKVFINRLLERNPVPIIWICNDVGSIHPSILRRMSFAMEIRTPTKPIRERIWRRAAEVHGLSVREEHIQQLAGRFEVPPALISNAARAVQLVGGDPSQLEPALTSVLLLLGEDVVSPSEQAQCAFDPNLMNASQDLRVLADRLCDPGASKAWSLCLSGASGTGKSQYARHLARRLGMEIIQKRASDLLSKWVGESEKNIAAAFRQAQNEGAMLVLEEADSLLQDRRMARNAWEVTQVNEVLTWMEYHRLPFVCTTNLAERLDPASLRRFTIKVRLDPLTRDQTARTFRQFFGIDVPAVLPEGLTPGDFATVRRKHEILGGGVTRIMDWLHEELESKGTTRKAIGFATSP